MRAILSRNCTRWLNEDDRKSIKSQFKVASDLWSQEMQGAAGFPTAPQLCPGGGDGCRSWSWKGGDGQLTRPSPWFEPPAGATDAGGTSHSVQALPSRMATNFVPSP